MLLADLEALKKFSINELQEVYNEAVKIKNVRGICCESIPPLHQAPLVQQAKNPR